MFCQHCGQEIAPEAGVCGSCGGALALPASVIAGPPASALLAEHAKTASRSAMSALKTLAADPIGGMQSAVATLGPQNALSAGIVFALVFDLSLTLAARRAMGTGNSFVSALGGTMTGPTFGDTLKLLIAGLIPFAAIAGANGLLRKVARNSGSTQGDCFIAGAALLPMALQFLVTSLLGLANFEVTLLLGVFALCYTVLMLHSGVRHVSGVAEPVAGVAVPLILLVSAWFTKIIIVAIL